MKNKRTARDTGLRLLSQREHTRIELADKLRKRGYGQEEIAALLDDFAQRGFLSERRAAELFLLKALSDTSYGLRYWHRKMIERGFPGEMVQEMLEKLRQEVDQKVAASALAVALSTRGKSVEQVARTLASRGFTAESITEALRKLRLDICEPGS